VFKIGVVRLDVDGDAAHALLNDFIVQAPGVGRDVHAVLGVRQGAKTVRGYVGQHGAPDGIGQTHINLLHGETERAVVIHERFNDGFGHFAI